MNYYRYQLEKGSKKHLCPSCQKRRFVRYIDIETKNYLPEIYGKCDRETNCAYHLNPYKDGFNKNNMTITKPKQIKTTIKPSQVFIPKEIFKKTRANYEQNIFIQNLLTKIPHPFEVEDIERVIALYHIGTVTNAYRRGSTTFPFIDIDNNIRAIQVKQFDKHNHTTGTGFLHSIIEKDLKFKKKIIPQWLSAYINQDSKVSCFFGEHLLHRYPHNPVGLVEAPKTAIYNTLYFGFPEDTSNYLWLAVYNLSSLSFKKCQALKGRNIFLFPDLSKDSRAFNLWSTKAKEYQNKIPDTSFVVSDLLEKLAPSEDREQGKDIADYIIKLDWRDFRKNEIVAKKEQKPISKNADNSEPEIKSPNKPKPIKPIMKEIKTEGHNTSFSDIDDIDDFDFIENKEKIKEDVTDWSQEIASIEEFFNNTNLPTKPIKPNAWSTITDCQKYIDSHLNVVKANNGKPTFQPYLERLIELKAILEKNQISKTNKVKTLFFKF